MISRFFKRDKKKEPAKKTAPKPVRSAAPKKQVVKELPSTPKVMMKPSKKLLTAEGWKRMMMKRAAHSKKTPKK